MSPICQEECASSDQAVQTLQPGSKHPKNKNKQLKKKKGWVGAEGAAKILILGLFEGVGMSQTQFSQKGESLFTMNILKCD